MREGKFYHDGRNEWIHYYYTAIGKAQYDKLRAETEDDLFGLPEKDAKSEIHVYPSQGITLKGYLGKHIAFKGRCFVGHTMYHQRSIVCEIKELKTSENAKSDTVTAAPLGQPSSYDIPDLIERATVFVIAIGSKEGDVRSGTGFFVAPGIIITNRHVVGECSAKIIVFGKSLRLPVSAQIVAISEKADRDYALLRIGKTASGYPSHLAFSNDAKRTDKVGAWGFPIAVIRNDPMLAAMLRGDAQSAPEVVYSEGVISTIQRHDPPLIVHTAIISHGNSGGPLMNVKGQVIGINTAISLDDKTYRQSGVAISASDIIKFMREHNINPTIAP